MTAGTRRDDWSNEALVAAVDASLQSLPPRRQLTGDEAYRLLFDLDTYLAEVAEDGGGQVTAEARAVIAESMRGMDGWSVVDRGRVENPLLDVRNLVAGVARA